MAELDQQELLKAKLNLETSTIVWKDLQPFFAAGQVIAVTEALDLIEVAAQVSQDNKTQVETWLAEGKIHKVTDQQATTWYENDSTLWAVVVRPWVLVQDKKS
ncbi:DUF2288 domain-containing protein [Spartinivicinus poritis]|uniref:DUF2288 domain-containing protein n=1 Tax=Spartinivicinus poritis TaxID=2994640 RepID=A0ABT5UBG8_9GAMM|nr:DUF2288 domain-containing protein [Spartinivicinus sp. A2-2]MDE1463729.1 DUF2288 domain-containing protein [Spartinivicinus sp. A2-2]